MGFREKTAVGVSKIFGTAKRHLIITTFLFVIFLLVGSYAGYETTRWLETPEFCSIAVCHKSMYPYSELYRQSAHGQRNMEYKCMECHGETRLGTIENKFAGVLLSHAIDSPPAFIALFQGKTSDPEFDPFYPRVVSERCLRCHAPEAEGFNTYPVTAQDHSEPIDVSEQFEWVLENPRGSKYECKNCHSFITHPSDTKLIPTERGEKYEYTHPGFPRLDFGTWQQSHWHLLRNGGNGDLEFIYSRENEGETYEVTSRSLVVNGELRHLDTSMCKICHKLERLRPENMDGKCQGCHNQGEITLYEHEPHIHIPNPNDFIGAKGIIGSEGQDEH